MDTARTHWLMNTLYSLRGYFRDEKPEVTHPLHLGQKPEGVIHHCIDSRVDLKESLRLRRGEYFTSAVAGALITSATHLGSSVQTRLNLGFPIENFPTVKQVVVMGHSHCGAVDAIRQMLLGPEVNQRTDDEYALLNCVPGGTQSILRSAHRKVGTVDSLRDALERSTILQSMRNFSEYQFSSHASVAHAHDNGHLHVTGAIESLVANGNGRLPIRVFDPKSAQFQPIEALYDEMFPAHRERRADMIETWVEQCPKRNAQSNLIRDLDRGIERVNGELRALGR